MPTVKDDGITAAWTRVTELPAQTGFQGNREKNSDKREKNRNDLILQVGP